MEQLILENQILIMKVLKELTTTSRVNIKELENQIIFTKTRIKASK